MSKQTYWYGLSKSLTGSKFVKIKEVLITSHRTQPKGTCECHLLQVISKQHEDQGYIKIYLLISHLSSPEPKFENSRFLFLNTPPFLNTPIDGTSSLKVSKQEQF